MREIWKLSEISFFELFTCRRIEKCLVRGAFEIEQIDGHVWDHDINSPSTGRPPTSNNKMRKDNLLLRRALDWLGKNWTSFFPEFPFTIPLSEPPSHRTIRSAAMFFLKESSRPLCSGIRSVSSLSYLSEILCLFYVLRHWVLAWWRRKCISSFPICISWTMQSVPSWTTSNLGPRTCSSIAICTRPTRQQGKSSKQMFH